MSKLIGRVLLRSHSRKGQGLVEYGLILTLVSILVMAALAKLSDPSHSPVVELGQELQQANSS